jgi:hypothetical protein
MTSSEISEGSQATRCRLLSRQVEILCVVLLSIEAAMLIGAATVISDSASAAWIYLAIGVLWAFWLITLLRNYRLVRCGSQSERFRRTGRMVNHPGFAARGFFHLMINWSAIAATLIAVAFTPPGRIHPWLSYLCIIATVATWAHFNLLHRRMNRARNLVLSTSCAVALLLIAVHILQRPG